LNAEIAAEKARKNDKDVLLIEAANILGDQVDLLKPGANLAARLKQIPLATQ
jgi:carboxyl-terminal processing protease